MASGHKAADADGRGIGVTSKSIQGVERFIYEA
jgi:hypothetical protein